MVTVRRLNTDELLDMLWEELPEMQEPGEKRIEAAPEQPFGMPTPPASGTGFPEPFSRPRRRGP